MPELRDEVAVVIPAHLPRLDDLTQAIATMYGPHLTFVVVTNEPNPIHTSHLDVPWPLRGYVLNTGSEDINLSSWWNQGLDWARNQGIRYMLVTESDCRLPYASIVALQDALDGYDLAMVGPSLGQVQPGDVQIERDPSSWGERSVWNRICHTWMVRTGNTVRADERYAWWVADEQHELRHREFGGTGIVGDAIYHEPPVQTTFPVPGDGRYEAIIEARRIFTAEHGFPPLV